MQYIINEGVLTDIIWEEGDGTALVIPDGVETLETQFNISRQIDTIILPKSIKTIKPFAFANENSYEVEIKNVYFDGTLSEWCAIEKGDDEGWGAYLSMGMLGYNLFLRDDTGAYQILKNLEIRNEIIKPISFYGCASLQSVTIYSSEVGEDAFQECKNLTKVSIYGATTELIENDCDVLSYPFDDREDLEIAFSMEAMDHIFEDWTCAPFLDYDNPLTVIETGDDIREIIETVESIDDGFYEKHGIPVDSPISKYTIRIKKLICTTITISQMRDMETVTQTIMKKKMKVKMRIMEYSRIPTIR